MSKTVIHVNRHHIAANAKDGGDRPVYTIKNRGKTTYAHAWEIRGGTVRGIDPRVTKPLSCGARAWIEVLDGEVVMTDPCGFDEARNPRQSGN